MHTPSKQSRQEYRLSDFDFDLPQALIAQFPAPHRTASRLMHVDGHSIAHRQFAELPDLLAAGDVLVLNDTRVMRARLFGAKPTGGAVEALVERVLSPDEALALVRTSKTPRTGSRIDFAGGARAIVLGREGDFFRLKFEGTGPLPEYLEQHGHLPLPPYISHADDATDAERYQTVYARHTGAVAAPTAGLHFDQALLSRLQARGVVLAWVTLHVGAGTFQPVRSDNLAEHRMHAERYDIPPETAAAIATARGTGSRIIAVGTTSLRALESAAAETGDIRPGSGETRLFITPGYAFRVVDRLVTNFHLPRSTLLMLVSAFAGVDVIREAYSAAIAGQYRFFSYGDAMLLERANAGTEMDGTER